MKFVYSVMSACPYAERFSFVTVISPIATTAKMVNTIAISVRVKARVA